ncbi:MAG: cytochrome c biogenesis protein ResB [Desulfuromonadaceae bacterium]|nr:cytochrome c biogenesis protein ResB [Desulfuromonadaceae bacterium]MDD5106938.1 cytochrome c biogenesis protein ResB [Desulfuromonadaceae bacterium]
MFKKLIKFLSSLRFTILLISLLGCIFAIGLWVPQKRLLKAIYLAWQTKSPALVAFLDSLGLTTIYTSPITITLWLLFFINLSLVVWQRIPVIKSRITITDAKITDPAASGGYPFRNTYPLPDDVSGEAVVEQLGKRGYVLIGNASGFYGVKNRLAPVAFMLFHLSFFLILLGGVISVYTEFIGYVDLAEGESFRGEIERYNESPQPKMPEIGSPPTEPIMVKSIVPQVTKFTPTGISVLLVDDSGATHDVDINRPYNVNNTSFVFKHLGVAPRFVLKDPAGTQLQDTYFKLDVLQMRPDRFAMDKFTFTATFYPDYALENGKRASRSMEFNNPMFFISVEQAGKKIGEGLVPKNGTLEFAGYRLEMRDMPFWVRFYIVKQRGLSILYAGFAIATIGVIWRLLFYRREIVGAVREVDGVRSLVVAGRSEYYKSLAEDEFTKLFGEIVGLKVES